MSLKRDLLAVILLVGLEPPTQAHDILAFEGQVGRQLLR